MIVAQSGPLLPSPHTASRKNRFQDGAETPGNREIDRGTIKGKLWEAGE